MEYVRKCFPEQGIITNGSDVTGFVATIFAIFTLTGFFLVSNIHTLKKALAGSVGACFIRTIIKKGV